MAIRYYDDLIITKLQRWIPEASTLRVLHPDETKKLFELTADDTKDRTFKLPLIALSRKDELELLTTVKNPKSYDGLRLLPTSQLTDFSQLKGEAYRRAVASIPESTPLYNVLPIRPEYQLDIYAKTAEECEEYVRNFLFKLINNPYMRIEIPYNDLKLEHSCYIRVLSNVANTSAITERIFSGQFTRWTIQFELHDAFLFSIPYKRNWTLAEDSTIEVSPDVNVIGEDI
jgi:hypothetical protein